MEDRSTVKMFLIGDMVVKCKDGYRWCMVYGSVTGLCGRFNECLP